MDQNTHRQSIGIALLVGDQVRYMNETFKQLNGIAAAELPRSWSLTTSLSGDFRIEHVLNNLTVGGAPWTGVIRMGAFDDQRPLYCSILRIGDAEYIVAESDTSEIAQNMLPFGNPDEWSNIKELLHGSIDAFWRWDLNTDQLCIEGALLGDAIVPSDGQEFPMEQLLDRIHTDDLRLAESAYERILRNEVSHITTSVRFRLDDGHFIRFSVKGRFVAWNEDGQATALAGTAVRYRTSARREMPADTQSLLTLIADTQTTYMETGELDLAVGPLLRAAVQYAEVEAGLLLACTSMDADRQTYRVLASSQRADTGASISADYVGRIFRAPLPQKGIDHGFIRIDEEIVSELLGHLMPDLPRRCSIRSIPLVGTKGCVGNMLLISDNATDNLESSLVGVSAIAATASSILDSALQAPASESKVPGTANPAEFSDVRSSTSLNAAVASITHELRQPLSAVLSITETIAAGVYGPLSNEQSSHLGAIHDDVVYMSSLVEDILEVATARFRDVTIELQRCEVAAVVADAVEMLQPLANAKHQLLQYSSSIPPNTLIQADPKRLKQVIVNLVGNAVRFTPKWGEINIEVIFPTNAKSVDVRVRDTGIGIESTALPYIFDAFGQLLNSKNHDKKSSGLGLSIAQHLVDAHGGMIEVDSTPGVGTTFTVSLPVSSESDQPVEQAVRERADDARLAKTEEIILIDENNLYRTRLELALLHDGYNVRSYSLADAALRAVTDDEPFLVVVKVRRIDDSALDVIRQLQVTHKAETHRPAILVLSSLVMPGDVDAVRSAGAVGLLSVSASIGEVRRMATVLRTSRTTGVSA